MAAEKSPEEAADAPKRPFSFSRRKRTPRVEKKPDGTPASAPPQVSQPIQSIEPNDVPMDDDLATDARGKKRAHSEDSNEQERQPQLKSRRSDVVPAEQQQQGQPQAELQEHDSEPIGRCGDMELDNDNQDEGRRAPRGRSAEDLDRSLSPRGRDGGSRDRSYSPRRRTGAYRDRYRDQSEERSRSPHARRGRYRGRSGERSYSPRERGGSSRDRHRRRLGSYSPGRRHRHYSPDRSHRDHVRGRGQKTFYQHKKPQFVEREESSDQEAMCAQMEFYFSDANLPTDKYMMKLSGGSENRPIPIKTIHTFGRMRRFKPYSSIVTAVRVSDKLDLVNDSEPGSEEVKRKVALSSEYSVTNMEQNKEIRDKEAEPRTAYMQGFTEECEDMQVKMEDWIKALFPGVVAVRLDRHRRNPKLIKGVSIELPDAVKMQNFVESFEGGKQFPEDGSTLTAKPKKQYQEEKAAKKHAHMLGKQARNRQHREDKHAEKRLEVFAEKPHLITPADVLEQVELKERLEKRAKERAGERADADAEMDVEAEHETRD